MKKYPTTIISVTLVILFIISSIAIAGDNYCIDKESWKEWDNLVAKNPSDMDIQTLHALRLGLCAKVERGDITVQETTIIFEKARESNIEKKKVEVTEDEDI